MGNANDFLKQLEALYERCFEPGRVKIVLNIEGKKYPLQGIFYNGKALILSGKETMNMFVFEDTLTLPDFLRKYKNALNGQDTKLLVRHPKKTEVYLLPAGIGLHLTEGKIKNVSILVYEDVC